MGTVSRRTLVGRLGLFLGAMVSGLLPVSAVLALERPEEADQIPATLRLRGRSWHLHAPDRVRGELPRRGDRLSMHGELLDGESSQAVGQFYSACFCPDTPGGSGVIAGMALEMHTFTLVDGSVMGVGMAGMRTGQESQFAIVGGTGRYAGARGYYTARQEPVELSGSGRAEFAFTFIK